MARKAAVLQSLSIRVYPTIEETQYFFEVGRFAEGELSIPAGSLIKKICVFSGPANSTSHADFAQKFQANGTPVEILIPLGARSIELPRECFSSHAIAFVADHSGSLTVRMRGPN